MEIEKSQRRKNTSVSKTKKKKHPGWQKMISEAINKCGGRATKTEISDQISTNYPSQDFAICKGSKFSSVLLNNLTKKFVENGKKNNEKCYKNSITTTKTKTKKKAKSKGPKIKPPHQKPFSMYRCCEIRTHKLQEYDIDKVNKIIPKACNERKNIFPQWNAALKVKFDAIDDNHDGYINTEQLTTILIEYVGYKRITAGTQASLIITAFENENNLISYEELLKVTPPMHRFYIYRQVIIPKLVGLGCDWYNEKESHPIADIFHLKVKAEIPDY
eukprot:132221_1